MPCATRADGGSHSCCSYRGNGCSSCCYRGYMNADCCPCFTDTDSDGIMDLADPDSDADWDSIPDAEESTGDSDSDGILDAKESTGACCSCKPKQKSRARRLASKDEFGLEEVDLSKLDSAPNTGEVRRQLGHYDRRIASGECEVRGYTHASCADPSTGRLARPCNDPTDFRFRLRFPLIWCYTDAEQGWYQKADSEEGHTPYCTDCRNGQIIGPTGEKCSTLAMMGTGSRRDFLFAMPCPTRAEGGSHSCCSYRGNGCSSCCYRGYMNADCCPCSKFTDTDSDGIMDLADPDSDADGIPDAEEGTGDSDSDGVPDALDGPADLNSDGVPDAEEGTGDSDSDGVPDAEDENDCCPCDSDSDGMPDAEEGTGDSDSDGIPDALDPDGDGDGVPDADEGADDPDSDGIPNYLDPDADGDGIDDAEEGTGDSDSDGIPDSLDIDAPPVESDSDSDGKPDTDEREGTGDMDSDGVPNMEDAKDDREWVMKPQPLCNLFTKTVFVGTTAVKQCAAVVLAPGEKCRHFAMSSKQCRGNG